MQKKEIMTNGDLTYEQKLDGLIAQKVFKKKLYKFNKGNENYPRWNYSYKKNPYPWDDQGETKWWTEDFVPQYSSKLKHAWKIVEKLNGLEQAFSLATCLSMHDKSIEYIAKWEKVGSSDFEFAICKTPQEAICIASLHLLGVKINVR